MRFAGPAIQAHLVQASTNLVDCEMLGQVVAGAKIAGAGGRGLPGPRSRIEVQNDAERA